MNDATNIYEQTPDDDTRGGRLTRAREARALTTRDLAWKLGVRQSTVTKWESDRSVPSSHRLSILAGLLDVSLSWLLHGVGTGPLETDEEDQPAMAEHVRSLIELQTRTADLLKRIEKDIVRRDSRRQAEA